MDLSPLTAISPVDGRYRSKTADLARYFSEYALMKYRVMIEIEYFICLCESGIGGVDDFDKRNFPVLRDFAINFSESDAEEIKEIEKTTNHDVKAVEYLLKKRFNDGGYGKWTEFIHFGLTSQDINNTAVPLLLRDFMDTIYKPQLFELREKIAGLADEWKDIPMLARTHGQPASPTRLGKEFEVFVARLDEQTKYFNTIPFSAKFGGATGNLNAHVVAYPDVDWSEFADYFVNDILGLTRSKPTTQIEHYDNLAALFDNIRRINTILLDMSRDIWSYISMDYFTQRIKAGEIGSSAMPHKVNPIDFENAEGNIGYANAIFAFLAEKLPVSRLQRDLTDSTVIRNIGVPLAHTTIAFGSLMKGLDKLVVNEEKINRDLTNNWAVVAEALQTILRREGYVNPYEALMKLTRTGDAISRETIARFIDGLDVEENIRAELRAVTPFNYTGI
ncbi:MAG: adenylosuccinate lyase [Bacteroidetes bacterium]|nr:adenylosuccinate lyase [Bacteroidota bacterium]